MDLKDVEKLAELARIELSEGEKKSLLSDMQGILNYVKIIEGVETDDMKPDLPPARAGGAQAGYNFHNVWREDVIEPKDFSLELITEQFSNSQDGFLKVKKIL